MTRYEKRSPSVAQLLAQTKHAQPLTIHATSRSGSDLEIQATPPNSIHYAKLDISDPSSIQSFLSTIKDNGIDVLINNAGINNNNSETPDLAGQVIATNYAGTRDMCTAFLSAGGMSSNKQARIVNVSSTACSLSNYSTPIQSAFRGVTSLSDVDALADSYTNAVAEGAQVQKAAGFGSPPMSYQVSKALVNALTVVLAKENPEVAINCCCPGWVDTDMGHQVGRPPKTLEEGARIPVRLAVGELGAKGDKDGGLGKESEERVSGRYFGNEGVTDRGWGRAREW